MIFSPYKSVAYPQGGPAWHWPALLLTRRLRAGRG
jgi:hypothetical protein